VSLYSEFSGTSSALGHKTLAKQHAPTKGTTLFDTGSTRNVGRPVSAFRAGAGISSQSSPLPTPPRDAGSPAR